MDVVRATWNGLVYLAESLENQTMLHPWYFCRECKLKGFYDSGFAGNANLPTLYIIPCKLEPFFDECRGKHVIVRYLYFSNLHDRSWTWPYLSQIWQASAALLPTCFRSVMRRSGGKISPFWHPQSGTMSAIAPLSSPILKLHKDGDRTW